MASLQALEAELKKLQVANKDSIERFDENLKRLAEKKLKSEVAIYQVLVSICTVFCLMRFGRVLTRLTTSPCFKIYLTGTAQDWILDQLGAARKQDETAAPGAQAPT